MEHALSLCAPTLLIFKTINMRAGYSLVEIIVYVGLVVVIGGITSAMTMQMINATARARASTAAIDNARRVVDIVGREIALADSVYIQTSSFGNGATGQISLVTTQNKIAAEPFTYVDYYLDNGQIYRKREGANAEQITGDNVVVESFLLTHLNGNPQQEAVRFEVRVRYDSAGQNLQNLSAVTLVSTVSMRDYAN